MIDASAEVIRTSAQDPAYRPTLQIWRLIPLRHLRGLSGIILCVVVDLATDELDRMHERIAGRFARAEPRARVRRYVSGLVAGLERKNG